MFLILSIGHAMEYLKEWILGVIVCKLQGTLVEVSYTISVWSLVAANFERYIAICHPLKRLVRSSKRAVIYAALIWVAAFLICSPLLDGYTVGINNKNWLDCSNRFKWSRKAKLAFYGVHSLFVFILPLIYMTITFYKIVQVLRGTESSTRDKINKDFNSTGLTIACCRERKASEGAKLRKLLLRNKKIVKILLVVTVVFVILWSPNIIIRLLKHGGMKVNEIAYKVSQIMILTTTAVNFFIYTIMSKELRKLFWSFFVSCVCCCTRRVADAKPSPTVGNLGKAVRFSEVDELSVT